MAKSYVYILRCADGTLYTGWTTSLEERLSAHNGEGKNGAKYTRARRPVRLVYFEEYEQKSQAMRRECEIKRLSRKEKEALIASWEGGDQIEKKELEKEMTQEEMVVSLLKERGWRIAFAESCTAGLAAGRLVDVPSASSVLDASFVTYANQAKVKYARVSEKTLAAFGAVSEQVAAEMAKGVAEETGAEVGVGISGIAGPGGGSPEKPVGTVCFGFYLNGALSACTCRFGERGRREVREAAVGFVFRSLALLLKQEK